MLPDILDDDLAVRIKKNKLKIMRPPARLSRFKMMKHRPQKRNKKASVLLGKAHDRLEQDGLNTVDYKIVNMTLYTGFTHFLFNIGEMHRKVTKKQFYHF